MGLSTYIKSRAAVLRKCDVPSGVALQCWLIIGNEPASVSPTAAAGGFISRLADMMVEREGE